MNNSETLNSVENEQINNTNMTQPEVQEDAQIDETSEEETIGENDIVIEEDFQINMDIADVSDPSSFTDSNSNEAKEESAEIGTEQSGNITF